MGRVAEKRVSGWDSAISYLLGTQTSCLIRSKRIDPCGMPAMPGTWGSQRLCIIVVGVLGWPRHQNHDPRFILRIRSSAPAVVKTLCSYYRQNVLFFWLWGYWAGEVSAVLWQGYGAPSKKKTHRPAV